MRRTSRRSSKASPSRYPSTSTPSIWSPELHSTRQMSDWTAAGSAVKALAAHPGYSATNLQSHSAGVFGKVFQAGNRVFATDADFGARQTLYAVSQTLPGDSFIGPRFAMRGPTGQSGAARWRATATTARALWTLSEQLTEVAIFPSDFGLTRTCATLADASRRGRLDSKPPLSTGVSISTVCNPGRARYRSPAQEHRQWRRTPPTI